MQKAINWFEIPASDFDRAVKFYETIFQEKLNVMNLGATKLAMFQVDWSKSTGGAIAAGRGFEPSQNGTKVYLSGGEDLSGVLGRVEEAGGKIVVPKTQITPEVGYMAAFIDTEGNWVGLHSPQ
ncbi:MAG: VOC family protein [Acidobacteria bacterium]|nr:VOC family protein [Acidobacteriota bacterium]